MSSFEQLTSMRMSVVQIGKVGMRVNERFVNVGMCVRLPTIPIFMGMLMVLIVRMRVAVLKSLVHVRMLVLLTQVQPDTETH